MNTEAVIRVWRGRGFIVADAENIDRYIITAAHCLPRLPPRASFSHTEERTYPRLLGQLRTKRRNIWAECLFVDPIADIAVLGQPDNQELAKEAEGYDGLVGNVVPFSIADAPEKGEGFMLSLEGKWFNVHVARCPGGPLWTDHATEPIAGGMSGSPIVLKNGSAIAVVTSASTTGGDLNKCTAGGPDPVLTRNLPGWLLTKLSIKKTEC